MHCVAGNAFLLAVSCDRSYRDQPADLTDTCVLYVLSLPSLINASLCKIFVNNYCIYFYFFPVIDQELALDFFGLCFGFWLQLHSSFVQNEYSHVTYK